MHPVLFTIPYFDKDVHIYGVMIAGAAIMVSHYATKQALKNGLPAEFFNDLVFWVLVSGIVGSRLEYMRVNWDQFSGDLGASVRIWEGGLVFYGGLIAAIVAFWFVCKTRKVPVLQAFDLVIPYVPFGHAMGRLGCFAAGCCYGETTEVAWGVKFPVDGLTRDIGGTPVHPTQLYAVGYLLLLGFFFLWLKKRQTFPGQMLVAYLATYPIFRSINEVFRGDSERGYFMDGPLSNAQFISVVIVVIALVIWFKVGRDTKQSKAA
jgi:phosphatidylglycerol---prolipoprotein diacylglyceryl transferase